MQIQWSYAEYYETTYVTIYVERFAGLNIRGFSPMKFFAEIILRHIGHQCLLFTYSKKFMGKLSWYFQKPQKFSSGNLSSFTVF